MMMRSVLAGLFGATGCLRKDVTHTIYVSPTGVAWSTVEKDVRSDESDPGNRLLEEHDYILAARTGQHPVARDLRSLGATRIETTILRNDRPFTVVTVGRFADLGALARAMLRQSSVRGDAAVDRDGCEKTFHAWIDLDAGENDKSDALSAPLDGADYRLVLTEGRFLRAEGFTIEEDGGVAAPSASLEPVDGAVRISLTWTEGSCDPVRRSW
jgi:hypothetical protein